MIRVSALDPGITTGWAFGLIDDGAMRVTSGQQEWDHLGLYNWLEYQKPEYIVCERFQFRQRQDNLELFSRELIGVTNLYVKQHKDVQLHMQSPSEALGGYFKNEKLKHDHVYEKGKPHANDAMRHLLYWFTFKQGYQFNQHGYR